MQSFLRRFAVSAETRVLDLGGSPFVWELAGIRPRLTILNLSQADFSGDWYEALEGDGCRTSFPNHEFDVVFSNSVIEHVGSWERQKQFAGECMRCGRGFFVQTPNKWFPVDPHTFLPLLHWFPRLFRRIVRWSPRALIGRISKADLDDLRNLRLLGKKELKALFPEAQILEEKFLGITKSLIAVSPALCPDQKMEAASHDRDGHDIGVSDR
ncbi:MAG: methyltransferase domain-containing protein [Candidatus Angelobacter sp.]